MGNSASSVQLVTNSPAAAGLGNNEDGNVSAVAIPVTLYIAKYAYDCGPALPGMGKWWTRTCPAQRANSLVRRALSDDGILKLRLISTSCSNTIVVRAMNVKSRRKSCR